MTNGNGNRNGLDPWFFYWFGIFAIIFTIFIILLNLTGIKHIPDYLSVTSIILALAFFIIAAGLSRKSEIATEAIMNSHLSETLGLFEDRRLTMREKMTIILEKENVVANYNNSTDFLIDVAKFHIYLSFSIWKCRRILNRALLFKNRFKIRDQEKIIHQIDCLFQDLVQGKLNFPITLSNEYKNHLQQMIDIICEFEVFNRDTDKEDSRRTRICTNFTCLQDHHSTFMTWEQ